jgi:hypothetical protein
VKKTNQKLEKNQKNKAQGVAAATSGKRAVADTMVHGATVAVTGCIGV